MSVLTHIQRALRTARILPKALAQAPAGTIRRRLIVPARRRARILLTAIRRLRVTAVDWFSGVEAGNRAFWKQSRSHDWAHVDHRLLQLHQRYPHVITQFTQLAYGHATNPEVLINLARSALTQDALRACLNAETFDSASSVRQRMIQSQITCAGFVAAATILLSKKESTEFARQVVTFSPGFSQHFMRLVDSCGTPLVNTPEQGIRARLPASGFRKPKKHRLILARSQKDVATLPLLFQGAESATVFILDDLYGRADFSKEMHHAGDCQVTVEHPRSRITRFCSDYHRLHEDTRAVAENLVTALATVTEGDLAIDDPAGTAMALADHLFFPCLQFAALEQLIASREFDHVVIAVGGTATTTDNQNNKFIRLLSGITTLHADPRVELVCLSLRQNVLKEMDVLLDLINRNTAPTSVILPRRRPLGPALRELQTRSDIIIKGIPDWPETNAPRVMLATSQVAAYNRSSAAYSQSLAEISNLRVAFLGGNLLSFSENTDAGITADMVVPLPQKPHGKFDLFSQWLEVFLQDQLEYISPDYIVHVIEGRIPDIAQNGILSYLVHTHLCHAWFVQLKAAGQLPKAVVLTPVRSIRVAAFAAVARRFNVPSIAIEPHGLNASYCRYSKVTTDYYGVISHFFAQAAVDGFGMSLDRCSVIGSPRLKAPDTYDLEAATTAARARISNEHDITFPADKTVVTYFTQPSDWSQISQVWRIILEATAGLDCQVFLKTHPEETASRKAAYLRIAKEVDATQRVHQIDADPEALIEASDLVLSGYSATVIEAALFRRPVFCVTNGNVDYPLNQHDVIGGALFRDVASLRAELQSFIKDATPYKAAAAKFLEREPQLVDGFGTHLKSLVSDIITRPAASALRPAADTPTSLFIDGPHTVYKV